MTDQTPLADAPCTSCQAPDLAFASHDHRHCQSATLARAEAAIRGRGQKMTPVRRRVLQILLESHRAMGAYDILGRLAAEGLGHQPPVVYRALDFLEEQGLAHRIRRLNAFAACMHPGETHAPAFLICKTCAAVCETAPGATAVRRALDGAARSIGFAVETSSVEALGQCAACSAAAG